MIFQKNNIMTWYAYRKNFDCSQFVTLRKWNKINNNQIKTKEILKYIEGFFGKIGEKPITIKKHKKISHKVIVIVKNGKIKQFRINPVSSLNIIKNKNPFNNTMEIIKNDEDNSANSFTYFDEFDYEKELEKDKTAFVKKFFKEHKNIPAIYYAGEELRNKRLSCEFVINPKMSDYKIKDIKRIKNVIKYLDNYVYNPSNKDETEHLKSFGKYGYDLAFYFYKHPRSEFNLSYSPVIAESIRQLKTKNVTKKGGKANDR